MSVARGGRNTPRPAQEFSLGIIYIRKSMRYNIHIFYSSNIKKQ